MYGVVRATGTRMCLIIIRRIVLDRLFLFLVRFLYYLPSKGQGHPFLNIQGGPRNWNKSCMSLIAIRKEMSKRKDDSKRLSNRKLYGQKSSRLSM